MTMVAILMLGFLTIAMVCNVYQTTTKTKGVEIELIELRAYIPNICEIQQKLNEAGYYDGNIDGIWGKETDTAYCNWAAAQHFK